MSVLCPISIQNVLALLIFGLGWGESTITIPQSLKVILSIQGSCHENEMKMQTEIAHKRQHCMSFQCHSTPSTETQIETEMSFSEPNVSFLSKIFNSMIAFL